MGPFRVTTIEGNNVALELPLDLKIHPVFSIDKVKQYYGEPPSAIPHYVNDTLEYEVEKILDKRIWHNHTQFLVKWKGLPVNQSQWLFKEDLQNCQELIQVYLSSGGGVTERPQ